MADDKTQNTGTEKPEGEGDTGSGEDAETGFWEKLAGVIDERIDEGVERALKKHAKIGTSRTGTKTPSVPGIIADIMFGKARD